MVVTFSFRKFTLSVVLPGKGQNCPLLPFSLIFIQEDVDLKWNPHLFVYVREILRRLTDDRKWVKGRIGPSHSLSWRRNNGYSS